jgi:hypothetical protein
VLDCFLNIILTKYTIVSFLQKFFPSDENITSVESIIQQEPGEEFDAWDTFGFPNPTNGLRSDYAGKMVMIVPVNRIGVLSPDKCPVILFIRGVL